MKNRNAPGELELLILKNLQVVKQATVHELEERLNHTYAYTTILTVLSRMYAKKLVDRTKKGRQHLYFVCSTKSNSLLERMKKRLFGGRTASMIQYLIESSDKLSKKELNEIETLIKKYKDES